MTAYCGHGVMNDILIAGQPVWQRGDSDRRSDNEKCGVDVSI